MSSHAKILVGLDPERQKVIVDTIIGQKLSVREVEKLVQQDKQNKKPIQTVNNQMSWMKSYESDLKKLLPFKHKLKPNKLEILFQDETQLQKFMEIIKKP